ncbi:MAG: hypothetical protein K5876_02750 [Ruminiclostridium sp.]|nr:hypothetical protein [Ruminiclostridium sp.]
MPISNIRDVSAGKGFSNSALNNRNSEQGGEAFSVSGAPKQEQLQAVSDKNAGNNASTTMGQKDLIPLAVTSTKNQTLAVETVKDIIDTGLLATAKLNGYTELVGELEQLSASLYIPAKDLLKEISEQEKQNTMFSGDKFYDMLRELAKEADGDQKEAIGNMLKAINFTQNRSEITTAVSANLRFLAEYFSPNRSLSGKLADLAEQWSSPDSQSNFAALRDRTSELMQNLSESLLNDSHTQTLLPIVTHNLSKFNTNTAMMRENFNQLLTLIPNYELRNELSRAFEGLLNKLINKNPDLIPRTLRDEVAEDSAAAIPPEFAVPAREEGEEAVRGMPTAAQSNAEAAQNSADTAQGLSGTAPETAAAAQNAAAQNDPQHIPLDNYTTNEQKNQGENEILGNEYQPDKTISAYLTNTLGDVDYVSSSGILDADFTSFVDNLRSGASTPEETIRDVLESLIEDDGVRQTLDRQLSDIHTPEQMINFLNDVLEAMPDSDLRNKVYEALEEAVSQMPDVADQHDDRVRDDEERRHGGGQQQSMNEQSSRQMKEKSSSIQALTDFVEKNINHPALKSIDSFNASNLLQSMINAPGVLTPLAHYILPIQIENTRAFGELWVDNNDDSGATGKGGGKHHHLFLTFDVDTYGRFEVDVYANDSSVRVNLLHPPTFARNVESIVQKVSRITAGTNYRIDDFQTGVLKEPHNLTQIFPKLTERRAGLNVKA